jgi:hypothetical protein
LPDPLEPDPEDPDPVPELEDEPEDPEDWLPAPELDELPESLTTDPAINNSKIVLAKQT